MPEKPEAEMEIQAENIDDVVFLLGKMKQMNLPTLLDGHIKRHPLEEGLSWGWVICIWLAYVVSQGDHRKLSVRNWVRQTRQTLSLFIGTDVRELDFTDDRLTIALRHLSQDERWNDIEQDLGRSLIRIYDLPQKTIRVDATTVSGHREGGEGSLWQFGHSKDDPTLRQIKLMMAALDPLGLPSALEIAPGQMADDGLYIPVLQRVLAYFPEKGKLVVGDSKIGAAAIRAYLEFGGQFYLTPLALKGDVAKQMNAWIAAGIAMGAKATKVVIGVGEEAEEIALGYELKRQCTHEGKTWEERVLIVKSRAWAETQERHLEKRLEKAEKELLALTPAVKQGKQQIREEQKLVERAEAILSKYEVTGLLTYSYEQERKRIEKLLGPGRGGPNRERHVTEQVRYQMTTVKRNEEAIAQRVAALGWRAYATNAPLTRLSFVDAVLEYRNEYRVERDFGRLKGPLGIAPMYVKRDDQVKGLARFSCIAVRLLVLTEFVVRRTLKEQGRAIAGLYLDSSNKTTTRPTAERILHAFLYVQLIIVSFSDQVVYQVKGLLPVHQDLLALSGLPLDLYTSLARTIPRSSNAPAIA